MDRFYGMSTADAFSSLAGLVASVGVCRNDMMDQFWEMYDAYCSKRPGQKLESTEWGQSGPDYKGLKGQKGNGSAWLRGCFKDVNIKVVGKRPSSRLLHQFLIVSRRFRYCRSISAVPRWSKTFAWKSF